MPSVHRRTTALEADEADARGKTRAGFVAARQEREDQCGTSGASRQAARQERTQGLYWRTEFGDAYVIEVFLFLFLFAVSGWVLSALAVSVFELWLAIRGGR